ncbi:MAG TPA: hypothetical protein ENN09_06160, partial [Planctomycetes bacterium]|nr:hypothetical protein [Planctomycetota bacterium]
MTTRKELFELKVPKDEDDLPAVQGDEIDHSARSSSKSGTSAQLPPGTVIFSVEQLTLLTVAVLILVVVAFLVGSYVSGKVEQRVAPSPPPEIRVVETAEDLLPDRRGELPLPIPRERVEEPAAAKTPSPAPAAADARYTLEVIRFRVEDRSVALMTVERLQKYGYAPVFLEKQGNELSVCVGRFADRNDRQGLLWKEEISN